LYLLFKKYGLEASPNLAGVAFAMKRAAKKDEKTSSNLILNLYASNNSFHLSDLTTRLKIVRLIAKKKINKFAVLSISKTFWKSTLEKRNINNITLMRKEITYLFVIRIAKSPE
jgi:hypothetical protein